ncbi:hypothetical protein D3C86_1788740 [compost metagenome]
MTRNTQHQTQRQLRDRTGRSPRCNSHRNAQLISSPHVNVIVADAVFCDNFQGWSSGFQHLPGHLVDAGDQRIRSLNGFQEFRLFQRPAFCIPNDFKTRLHKQIFCFF